MRAVLPFLLLTVAGCRTPQAPYVLADTPEAYFESLPSVAVPQSHYADADQSKWFTIGYREGYQRGSSGVNAHSDPWYPQHQQCTRLSSLQEAHRKGFDAGYAKGFAEAQERLRQIIDSLGRKAGGEPDGAANGSQPIRSETNQTSPAAGSRR